MIPLALAAQVIATAAAFALGETWLGATVAWICFAVTLCLADRALSQNRR